MKITDLLLGKALPTWMERAERVGIATGVAIFGLDALSSAVYGPEAALTMLIPLRRLSHVVGAAPFRSSGTGTEIPVAVEDYRPQASGCDDAHPAVGQGFCESFAIRTHNFPRD
jgi:hypothetical protein